MQQFRLFVDKSYKIFKMMSTSGVNLGKVRPNVISFLGYVNGEFQQTLDKLEKEVPGLSSVNLGQEIGAKYRFLLKRTELKHTYLFLKEFKNERDRFKGKESNETILYGVYFLYFMLVVKLVETYINSLKVYSEANPNFNVSKYSFSDFGLGNDILKHYKLFEDVREKTLDDWVNAEFDSVEERFILSMLKRIFMIMGA